MGRYNGTASVAFCGNDGVERYALMLSFGGGKPVLSASISWAPLEVEEVVRQRSQADLDLGELGGATQLGMGRLVHEPLPLAREGGNQATFSFEAGTTGYAAWSPDMARVSAMTGTAFEAASNYVNDAGTIGDSNKAALMTIGGIGAPSLAAGGLQMLRSRISEAGVFAKNLERRRIELNASRDGGVDPHVVDPRVLAQQRLGQMQQQFTHQDQGLELGV